MPASYSLERLAPGSYDLLLDGVLVGGVVRDLDAGERSEPWRVELLDEGRPAPAPFTASEHRFASWEGVLAWLGIQRRSPAETDAPNNT